MSVAAPEHSCLFPRPERCLVPWHCWGAAGRARSRLLSLSSSPCQEILLWFLEKSEREASLAVLEGFAGLNSSVHSLHPRCQFCVGAEGGATIAVEEMVR